MEGLKQKYTKEKLKEQKNQNAEIEKLLRQTKKELDKEVKLLLLGQSIPNRQNSKKLL